MIKLQYEQAGNCLTNTHTHIYIQYIYIYIGTYPSTYLYIYLSIYRSIYLSICLSIYLSIHPSIYLSISGDQCRIVEQLSTAMFNFTKPEVDTAEAQGTDETILSFVVWVVAPS